MASLAAKDSARRDPFPLPEAFQAAVGRVDLPTITTKVTGLNWYVEWSRMEYPSFRGEFMIRGEPTNRSDSSAVAVFIGRHQIGYLRSAKAKSYSPVLRRLGDSLEVVGEWRERQVFLRLPRVVLLREYAEERSLLHRRLRNAARGTLDAQALDDLLRSRHG